MSNRRSVRAGYRRGRARLLAIGLLVAVVTWAWRAQLTAEPQVPPPTGAAMPATDFVFFNPDASGLPVEDVYAALEKYATFLRNQNVVDFNVRIYRRATDLETYLASAREAGRMPLIGSMSVPYLLQRGFRHGYYPIACAVRNGEVRYSHTVVTRRSSKIRTLADAKGAVLALTDVGIDVVDFMNTLMFEGKIDLRSYFSKLVLTDSPASSVTAVLFRQADVALLDGVLFGRMTELAPTIWKDMRQIYTAPPIHLSGAVAWVGAPPELIAKFRATILGDIRSHPGGDVFLRAFFMDGFRECAWADFDGLEGRYLRAAGIPLVTSRERQEALRAAAQ